TAAGGTPGAGADSFNFIGGPIVAPLFAPNPSPPEGEGLEVDGLAGSPLAPPGELPGVPPLASGGGPDRLGGGVAGTPGFRPGTVGGGGAAGVFGVAKSWLIKMTIRGLGGVAQVVPASFGSLSRVRAINW